VAVGTRNDYPKTALLLSAAPGLLPEDARAAAVIERDLEALDAGDPAAADRLIDYIWPSDPAFSVTLPDGLTASEVEHILVALLREQERIRTTRRALVPPAGSPLMVGTVGGTE
jgi:hypothetical protein